MDEQRAGRLQALRGHPSWSELEAAVAEHRLTFEGYVTKVVMTTGELPADFEFKRGFLAGMKYVTRYPGVAEKTLERAIAKSKAEGDDA